MPDNRFDVLMESEGGGKQRDDEHGPDVLFRLWPKSSFADAVVARSRSFDQPARDDDRRKVRSSAKWCETSVGNRDENRPYGMAELRVRRRCFRRASVFMADHWFTRRPDRGEHQRRKTVFL